ncbi:MAG: hypothetical protein M0R06_02180 [Sphaerochaeta sp.]|nr:hypothetical protein [Sphaerochaeta sp.]
MPDHEGRVRGARIGGGECVSFGIGTDRNNATRTIGRFPCDRRGTTAGGGDVDVGEDHGTRGGCGWGGGPRGSACRIGELGEGYRSSVGFGRVVKTDTHDVDAGEGGVCGIVFKFGVGAIPVWVGASGGGSFKVEDARMGFDRDGGPGNGDRVGWGGVGNR